jgi:dynein heavy chain
MEQLEDILIDMRDTVAPSFRLFMSAMPHPKFPLGLLQMSVKVCNEAPVGLRAGLQRAFSTIVTQVRRLDYSALLVPSRTLLLVPPHIVSWH